MKKLLPAIVAILIVLCGCNSNKSFTHQRYTHFKHKKSSPVTEPQYYAEKGSKEVLIPSETAVMTAAPEKQEPMPYTQAVVNRVILPVAQKGKEQAMHLVASNSKMPVTQVSKIKPITVVQKQEKRGLLFGVIDAILGIVLLAVFVALVIVLVLILI